MDTSEEYILMSQKAWPYLEPLWKWDIGDFFGDGVESGIISSGHLSLFEYKSYYPLPRQDQLQGILADHSDKWDFFNSAEAKLNQFYHHVKKYDFDAKSFEQLWLMLLMKERFNKVWNDEDWIE